MAKRIALAVLTLALVGTWGVLPAMAEENPATKVVIEEAKKLLWECLGEATGKADAIRTGKTARDLAAEIAAVPTL